jgi:hypothetical protein
MFWMILSWVFVLFLTGINIFTFLKLKKAADQMMQMAMPGVKNMGDAMNRMKQMMGGGNNGNFEAQMKSAMQMLQQMQRKK